MTVRDSIIAGARRWLGTPYVWGGESAEEGGVDCSGLVIAAYKAAGVPLSGRPIASQLGKMGTSVGLSDALPGDVIYKDNPGPTDHVGIYIGSGQMIEAPYTGANVRVSPVGTATSIRRLLTGSESGSLADQLEGSGPISGTAGVDESLIDSINPFDNWVRDGFDLGIKVVAVVGALALVVVGAKSTVSNN